MAGNGQQWPTMAGSRLRNRHQAETKADTKERMKTMLAALKKIFNWSYPRGSWQYDLLCLLIIALIFLTPASLFEEQKKSPDGTAVVSEVKASSLREFLGRKSQSEMLRFPPEALNLYLREQYNRPVRLIRYEEIGDSPEKLLYRVWIE